jgi:predicted transcriptional regulator
MKNSKSRVMKTRGWGLPSTPSCRLCREEQVEEAPAVSRKKAFGRDKVICMICGKGMKTLTRHLRTAHGLKPAEYRVQFDLPKSQSLVARSYSESRRQMAIDKGLGDNLAKARAARGKGRKKK